MIKQCVRCLNEEEHDAGPDNGAHWCCKTCDALVRKVKRARLENGWGLQFTDTDQLLAQMSKKEMLAFAEVNGRFVEGQGNAHVVAGRVKHVFHYAITPDEFDLYLNGPNKAPTRMPAPSEIDKAALRTIIAELVKNEIESVQERFDSTMSAFDSLVNDEKNRVVENIRDDLRKEHGNLKKESEDLMDDFRNMATLLVQNELDKVRPIEIRVNDNPPVRMDEPLPAWFEQMAELAIARENILLVGPSGCGKTHVSAMLARSLSLPFGAQSLSEGVTESQFFGWMLPTEQGGMAYHDSLFVNLYENGGVFLLDEFDNADPNLLSALNQALANGELYIPQRLQGQRIKKHPDFICVASANTLGHGGDEMYIRNRLDAATLDRFAIGTLVIDYDTNLEQRLVSPEVFTWGMHIRSAIREHNLQRLMTTRTMVGMQKMADRAGWDCEDWNKKYFATWTEDEKRLVQ